MVLEKPSALQELSTREPTHTAGACYKSTLELLPPERQFPWFLSPKERIQSRDRAVVNSKSRIKQGRRTLQTEKMKESRLPGNKKPPAKGSGWFFRVVASPSLCPVLFE